MNYLTSQGDILTEAEQATSTEQIQVIPASSNPTQPPLPPVGGLIPMLIYGGVAVAVIVAMTWYSQALLEKIDRLVKTLTRKTK